MTGGADLLVSHGEPAHSCVAYWLVHQLFHWFVPDPQTFGVFAGCFSELSSQGRTWKLDWEFLAPFGESNEQLEGQEVDA